MAWYPLAKAAQAKGVSRATLERRIQAEEVPSYLDGPAGTGRRMVWWAGVTLEHLAAEVASLRAALNQAPAPAEEPVAPPELKADDDQVDVATVAMPDPSPSQTFQSGEAIPHEVLLIELGRKQARLGLSDAEMQRQLRLPPSFVYKAKLGRLRGPKARRSWGRIAAFVAA